MEKSRNFKIIAVIALIVAIFGLSVGFAAFSTALNISTSQSAVRPDETTFNVSFSSSGTSFLEEDVVGQVSDNASMTSTAAKIDNSNYKNPVINNLSAKFTEPGQSVTYTFYAYNGGSYDAYLKSISFLNVDGKNQNKVCAPIITDDGAGNLSSSATDSLVQTACEDIKLKVDVIGEKSESASGTIPTITSHKLGRNGYEKIVVTMKYEGDEPSTRADGDFTVDFGSIVLNYGSVDNQ